MNPPNSARQGSERAAGQGVVCAKCAHLNPPGANTCEQCEAHLWVVCHHCGHRNRRADARCLECGHRLHRPFLRRLSKKFFPKQKVAPWQIAILLLGIWVGYKLVVFFAEYRVPPPEQ